MPDDAPTPYFGILDDRHAAGTQLRAEALRRGKRPHSLTTDLLGDTSASTWEDARLKVPKDIEIIDLCLVSEHAGHFAYALLEARPEATAPQCHWCHAMKADGGAHALPAARSLLADRPNERSPEQVETARHEITASVAAMGHQIMRQDMTRCTSHRAGRALR